jgi:hypothetical protein
VVFRRVTGVRGWSGKAAVLRDRRPAVPSVED